MLDGAVPWFTRAAASIVLYGALVVLLLYTHYEPTMPTMAVYEPLIDNKYASCGLDMMRLGVQSFLYDVGFCCACRRYHILLLPISVLIPAHTVTVNSLAREHVSAASMSFPPRFFRLVFHRVTRMVLIAGPRRTNFEADFLENCTVVYSSTAER